MKTWFFFGPRSALAPNDDWKHVNARSVHLQQINKHKQWQKAREKGEEQTGRQIEENVSSQIPIKTVHI